MQLLHTTVTLLHLIWNCPSVLIVLMPTIPSFLNFAKTQGWSLLGNLPFMVGVQVRVLGDSVDNDRDL